MNWLFWRQHRKQILFTGVALLAYAAALIIFGAITTHNYNQVVANHGTAYGHDISGAARYLPLATIALPLLFGMFWGAPLIAKEYEEGTNKLAWTQSVTRRRWLTVKLGWMMSIAALYAVVISLAAAYCLHTEQLTWGTRFEWVHFDVQGIVPITYAVFAVALGAAIGAWRRRVLPALALTLAIFVVLQGAMGVYIRPHYKTPLVVRTSSYYRNPKTGGESVLLKTTTSGPAIPTGPGGNSDIWDLGRSFHDAPLPCTGTPEQIKDQTCNRLTQINRYQPAHLFWPFQIAEAGIYLGATLVLIGTTYWLVLKRDA